MKRQRFIHTSHLDTPKEVPYPTFPPIPDLPLLSLHLDDDKYFCRMVSKGVYDNPRAKFRNVHDVAPYTETPVTAVMQGLVHFSLGAAMLSNARGDYLGLILDVNAFKDPNTQFDQLAAYTALRMFLQPGLAERVPTDDSAYDQVIALLTSHKRKVYTSKLSGKVLEGKDVITQQLCAELNDEILAQVKDLSVSAKFRQSPPAASPRSKTTSTSKEPNMSKRNKTIEQSINDETDQEFRDKLAAEPRVKLEGSLSPTELAAEFNTSPQKLRKALRQLYSGSGALKHAHRQRWLWHPDHDADELELVREELARSFTKR